MTSSVTSSVSGIGGPWPETRHPCTGGRPGTTTKSPTGGNVSRCSFRIPVQKAGRNIPRTTECPALANYIAGIRIPYLVLSDDLAQHLVSSSPQRCPAVEIGRRARNEDESQGSLVLTQMASHGVL